MSERYVSNAASEVEYTKKHIASLSGQGVSYNREFALEPEERERKIPIVAVPVVKPPEPLSASASASTSNSSSDSPSITLTIKSLKPPLSFTQSCSLTSSISQLKGQLYSSSKDKGAPEPERQRWLYKGKAMADERLLKEYEGVKDGETVHLSIKAGTTTAATPAAASSAASDESTTPTGAISPMASPLPTAEKAAAPSPFGFQSQSMSGGFATPLSPSKMSDAKRTRTSSTASLSASRGPSGGRHARVPSITLTTDISNFNNLAGNSTSPIDENLNPGVPLEGSSTALPAGSPPFRPQSPGQPGSGASTPKSAPGTPAITRARGPSISIPIDLDNVEMMNPLSSDRKTPVGLSPVFLSTIKDPKTWTDILAFLDKKFDGNDPMSTVQGSEAAKEQGEYREETKRVFETWLGSSKDYMTASDIARIRDSTGVWAMGGR